MELDAIRARLRPDKAWIKNRSRLFIYRTKKKSGRIVLQASHLILMKHELEFPKKVKEVCGGVIDSGDLVILFEHCDNSLLRPLDFTVRRRTIHIDIPVSLLRRLRISENIDELPAGSYVAPVMYVEKITHNGVHVGFLIMFGGLTPYNYKEVSRNE